MLKNGTTDQLLDIAWAAYSEAMQADDEERFEWQNSVIDQMNDWCEGNLLDKPLTERETIYLMDLTLTGLRYGNW